MVDNINEDMFLDRLPDYLRCPVCLCCLTNPYQTPCGHRFCKDCILPIIHSRNPVCPVDRTPVGTNNTFPDNAAKLQINGLKTRCLNKGCDWTGEYSDWIAHKCAYAPVPCNYCNVLVSKAELDTHIANCPKRKVSCEYCELKVAFCDLSDHHTKCLEYPIPCRYGCSSQPIPRQAIEEHYNSCPAIPVPCTMAPFGCSLLIKRAELADHLLTCAPTYTHKMATTLLELQKQVAELTLKVEAQGNTVQTLESTLYPSTGQFTWKIEDIRSKIRTAEVNGGDTSALYSPSFYSYESGYKMCLCVYPAGDNHEGFLSLYFVLMKGQFDELLPWPFQNRVILYLLNCNPNKVHSQPLTKDIRPDPTLHYFSRPIKPKNVGYGYPKFIALSKLLSEDSDYVQNNAIFIRACIYP